MAQPAIQLPTNALIQRARAPIPQPTQAFPSGTKPLALLSNLAPEQKQTPERKPILSKNASIEYLATAEEGRTMLQAIEEANKNGLTLIPNIDIDERLNGKEQIWKAEQDFYPCWTGTLIIYAAPNQEFGKEISFGGLRVKIPKKWQHRRNCAIVCNHPNFTIEKDGTIKLKKAVLIENFPAKGGWYKTDKKFGIPCGVQSNETDNEARRLWRQTDNIFVGLVARGFDDFFYVYFDRRDVGAVRPPSDRLGVLGTRSETQEAEEIQK